MDHTHRTTITHSIENEEEDKSKMVVHHKWNEMIPQKRMMIFGHSTHGLLISNFDNSEIFFMHLTQSGQIEVSDFTYDSPRPFSSGCNGFLLESHIKRARDKFSNSSYQLVIADPATNQRLALPPFTEDNYCMSTIAYAPARREYKVVRSYCPGYPLLKGPANVAIMTVGVDDSWRLMDNKHLSASARAQFKMSPLATDGFVHWAQDARTNGNLKFNWIFTARSSENDVLTLNVETEVFTWNPAPPCGRYYYYRYLSTGGRNLSLLIGRGYLKWDVWEMKSETGEWTNLPGIDLKAHKDLLNQSCDREESCLIKPGVGDRVDCKLVPAGWLKYREVIVFVVYRPIRGNSFRQSRLRAVYNLQTQDVTLLMLGYSFHPFLAHMNNQLIIGMQSS